MADRAVIFVVFSAKIDGRWHRAKLFWPQCEPRLRVASRSQPLEQWMANQPEPLPPTTLRTNELF